MDGDGNFTELSIFRTSDEEDVEASAQVFPFVDTQDDAVSMLLASFVLNLGFAPILGWVLSEPAYLNREWPETALAAIHRRCST